MITREQYLEAKKIVNEYETEKENLFKKQLVLLEDELKAYFASKKVGERVIRSFRLDKNWAGTYSIIPLDPFMDEDYEDDEADEEIAAIGLKYGLNNFGFISNVYPK